MNQKAIKDVLKSMPIWEPHDQMKLKWQILEHQIDSYSERQDERDKSFVKLANLNDGKKMLRPSTVINNSNSNDEDVISTYQKSAYEELDKVVKVKKKQNKVMTKTDILRDESVIILEKKIKADDEVYAMHEPGKPWVKCKVICIVRKPIKELGKALIIFRLKVLSNGEVTNRNIDVNKFAVARIQNHSNMLCISKRVIAGLSTTRMFPGIIGQEPCEFNYERYLVLMDNGSACYFMPHQIYPIFYQSVYPWQDMHYLENQDKNILAQLRAYFYDYPRRHLFACKEGDHIKINRYGTLVSAEIIDIDVDTMRVLYKDQTEESVHRGSTRLISSSHEKCRQVAMVNSVSKLNENLLFAMAKYHKAGVKALDEDFYNCIEGLKSKVYVSGKNQTARKSTSLLRKKSKIKLDDVMVELTNLNCPVDIDPSAVEYSKKHRCDTTCLKVDGVRTETSITDIVDEFRKVSDLKVPLILGWKRMLIKIHQVVRCNKTRSQIVYIAPCGKIFKQLHEIRRYIMITKSKLDIDYFTLDKSIELNNPQEVDKIHYEENIAIDKKTKAPLENKNISLLNCEDNERLPVDFEYNNKVVPHIELIKTGFTFNYDFKSCCDCEDDCFQRATCACHRLTEESAGKTAFNRGTVNNTCQYTHKRLKDQVNTGIFECNSFCKCSSKCSNRVVQNGIKYRLQVMKMPGKKGWGVITKDDIPEGAFICTYSAEMLDDADQYGNSDMYYADLDYITVNEAMKEGIEEEEDKNEDEGFQASDDENLESNGNNCDKQASCSNETNGNNDCFEKTKNKRVHGPSSSESSEQSEIETIESDADVCENSKKTNQNSSSSSSISSLELEKTYTPEKSNGRYPVRKTRTVVSNQVSTPYGNPNYVDRDRPVHFKRLHTILKSRDFTLDARMQGNIGRFFNHSCSPNAFVQNVFIETHDLRFPVVAFFANKTIKATSEITWNYNYKTGSIEGRRIDCECGSANCKGRIL